MSEYQIVITVMADDFKEAQEVADGIVINATVIDTEVKVIE